MNDKPEEKNSDISDPAKPEIWRKRPVQKRSQETVDIIIDAATSILSEEGLEQLSTKKISKRSQINIASIYQYFPNKNAIIQKIAERLMDQAKEVYAGFPDAFAEAQDWRVPFREYALGILNIGSSMKGGRAVRTAIQIDRSYAWFDRLLAEHIGELMSVAFMKRAPHLTRVQSDLIARTVVTVGTKFFASYGNGAILVQMEPDLSQEMLNMIEAYVAKKLEPESKPALR